MCRFSSRIAYWGNELFDLFRCIFSWLSAYDEPDKIVDVVELSLIIFLRWSSNRREICVFDRISMTNCDKTTGECDRLLRSWECRSMASSSCRAIFLRARFANNSFLRTKEKSCCRNFFFLLILFEKIESFLQGWRRWKLSCSNTKEESFHFWYLLRLINEFDLRWSTTTHEGRSPSFFPSHHSLFFPSIRRILWHLRTIEVSSVHAPKKRVRQVKVSSIVLIYEGEEKTASERKKFFFSSSHWTEGERKKPMSFSLLSFACVLVVVIIIIIRFEV